MNSKQIALNKSLDSRILEWGNSIHINLKNSLATSKRSKVETLVWNHIINHAHSKEKVCIFKKNVLLNHLKQLKKDKSAIFTKDGIQCVEASSKYNDSSTKLEEHVKDEVLSKDSLSKNERLIADLDKIKEKLLKNTKEHKHKNILMKINLKRINELLKTYKNNIEFLKTVRTLLSDRIKKENVADEILVNNVLKDIEALFHSYNLAGNEVDLTLERDSLWKKSYDVIPINPTMVLASIVKYSREYSSEYDILNSVKNKTPVLPPNIKEEIEILNINMFFKFHNLKARVNKLRKNLESTKREFCLKNDDITNLNLTMSLHVNNNRKKDDCFESNSMDTFISSIIDKKLDQLIKMKTTKYMKAKIEELKDTETNIFQFHLTMVSNQMENLGIMNEKIIEKGKLITKFLSPISSDNYLNYRKLFIDESVNKLEKVKNIFIEKNISDSNTDIKEHCQILKKIKGLIKNERSIFVQIPYEELLYQNPSSHPVEDSNLLNFNSNVVLTTNNLLVNKRMVDELNIIIQELNKYSSSSMDIHVKNDLKLETVRQKNKECKENILEDIEKICCNLNIAKKTIKDAKGLHILLNDDIIIKDILLKYWKSYKHF